MKKSLFKNIVCGILACMTLWSCRPIAVSAADAKTMDVLAIAQGIIDWKKSDNGAPTDGYLINNKFLELAGTTPGDWFPIGLGRLGIQDNNTAYLAVLQDQVEQRYQTKGQLSSAKATEWHRISLAILAMGGDPTCFGTYNGQTINLIADGTYDRGKTVSLGRQGINGWIWGLIALDSLHYEVPSSAYNTREDIIQEILCRQLSDGGFALSGSVSDTDITAMVIQALAPYYNSEKTYSYQQKAIKTEVTKTVRQVVDEALSHLSATQTANGDYQSWGTNNVESTDQVLVALCALGIDPLTDLRFIKNGNTLLDGILRYRMADGGFVHSYTYDPDNPTSLPDQSNTMASEQTLYTMAALWRHQNGMRTLYDFRPEQSASLKETIAQLEQDIAATNENTPKAQLEALLDRYYAIDESERSYVSNFWHLRDLADAANTETSEPTQPDIPPATEPNTPQATQPNIPSATEPDAPPATEPSDDVTDPIPDGEDTVLLYFAPSDMAAVDALPEKLTTEHYVTVITLLYKLENSEDFEGKEAYFQKLTSAQTQIAAIQAEIDSINADIKAELYPFDKIDLADKEIVDSIVARYEALSDYDKAKIDRWEDVIKTKTKIDNLLRGIVIGTMLCAVVGVIAVCFVLRIRKRRRQNEKEMEELAAQYEDEE